MGDPAKSATFVSSVPAGLCHPVTLGERGDKTHPPRTSTEKCVARGGIRCLNGVSDQPALAEPLAEALAFTDTSICTDASAWALSDPTKQAPTFMAASPPP